MDNLETTAADIDLLMQDTWLLALAIRNGQPPIVDDVLYQHCFDMIQQVQDKLIARGVPEYLTEEIKFAHCIFVDEAVMSQPDTDVSTWWRRTPLQGHFLHHIHGGDLFHEHIKKLLREPTPSPALVTCYYRMLSFGYAGKYRKENDIERLTVMQQLETLLPKTPDQENHHAIVVSSGDNDAQWWRSPQVILMSLLLMTAGIWAGLRFFLLAQ